MAAAGRDGLWEGYSKPDPNGTHEGHSRGNEIKRIDDSRKAQEARDLEELDRKKAGDVAALAARRAPPGSTVRTHNRYNTEGCKKLAFPAGAEKYANCKVHKPVATSDSQSLTIVADNDNAVGQENKQEPRDEDVFRAQQFTIPETIEGVKIHKGEAKSSAQWPVTVIDSECHIAGILLQDELPKTAAIVCEAGKDFSSSVKYNKFEKFLNWLQIVQVIKKKLAGLFDDGAPVDTMLIYTAANYKITIDTLRGRTLWAAVVLGGRLHIGERLADQEVKQVINIVCTTGAEFTGKEKLIPGTVGRFFDEVEKLVKREKKITKKLDRYNITKGKLEGATRYALCIIDGIAHIRGKLSEEELKVKTMAHNTPGVNVVDHKCHHGYLGESINKIGEPVDPEGHRQQKGNATESINQGIPTKTNEKLAKGKHQGRDGSPLPDRQDNERLLQLISILSDTDASKKSTTPSDYTSHGVIYPARRQPEKTAVSGLPFFKVGLLNGVEMIYIFYRDVLHIGGDAVDGTEYDAVELIATGEVTKRKVPTFLGVDEFIGKMVKQYVDVVEKAEKLGIVINRLPDGKPFALFFKDCVIHIGGIMDTDEALKQSKENLKVFEDRFDGTKHHMMIPINFVFKMEELLDGKWKLKDDEIFWADGRDKKSTGKGAQKKTVVGAEADSLDEEIHHGVQTSRSTERHKVNKRKADGDYEVDMEGDRKHLRREDGYRDHSDLNQPRAKRRSDASRVSVLGKQNHIFSSLQ